MESWQDRLAEGRQSPPEDNDAIVSWLAQQDKIPWHRKANLRGLYISIFLTCLGVEMTCGCNASMINNLQAVNTWIEYYNHPRSVVLGTMASMYYLGCVAAVPFAPIVVDKFGRRYPILLGGIITVVGGILQGCALNFIMFILARFILGFSSIFCLVATSALIGELSHPKERAVIGTLCCTCFYLGAIAATAVTLVTFSMKSNWGWRIPALLQTVPSILQVSSILFIPESPRWLVSRGRRNEALAILVRYHAEGDESSDFVKAEFAQIEEALKVTLKVSCSTWHRGIFSTPGMRKRMLIAMFIGLAAQFNGSALISHYLAPVLDIIGIHDNRTKNIVNLAKVSWKFINGIVIALFVPRYPRRSMYLTCTISIFIIVSAFTFASAEYSITHNQWSSHVVLALIFLHSPAYNVALGSLEFTFLTELFPFHVRSSGIAWSRWWNGAGGFLAQFANPIGIGAAGWRWYIAYCIWDAFQVMFVYLMFPETSGRTLEELAFLFEEDREVLLYGDAGTLRHRVIGTYGTMEGDPGRTVYDNQTQR